MKQVMEGKKQDSIKFLTQYFVQIISETNGISLMDTLELATQAFTLEERPIVKKNIVEFQQLLTKFHQDKIDIESVLVHPVATALGEFFKHFPLPYREEHIHLTGSLSAKFVYPKIKALLDGPHGELYWKKIKAVYGENVEINSVTELAKLLTLGEGEQFDRYLQILLIPKLVLQTRVDHEEAAYHMASELYHKYNVGLIRLKFSLLRATKDDEESIPGLEKLTEEDVVLGLYNGFQRFRDEVPEFKFVLSPCFRKEESFFDEQSFDTKREHFMFQINKLLQILEKYSFLKPYLCDVDTVGNERNLYRKSHFQDMKQGFRRLQYKGFSIRSHHGETWNTLNSGVQAVDNAMNIWHIDTLEHGVSLGINPNFYFHSLYQRVISNNRKKLPVQKNSSEYRELMEMDWNDNIQVRDKLFKGIPLDSEEQTRFVKVKFHTAREIEHYQHDVLNRMIHKNVSLISLPSSNNKLTGCFPDYKDHPFSWWEKKGVQLGIGTDNYITLDTNYIKELLILLITDAYNLKITKLIMVATGEQRRPFISQLLWKMRESMNAKLLEKNPSES